MIDTVARPLPKETAVMATNSQYNGARITVAMERITPQKAEQMLARNSHNRNIRPRRVELYTRDMEAGNWMPTGEPIQVGSGGELWNGQHRLHAVVEANVTVTMPVMHNVPREFQAVADQGASRSFADVLKLQFGETDVFNMAAAVRHVYAYRTIGRFGGTIPLTPSISELTATYLREQGLRDSLAKARTVKAHGVWTPNSLAAALHYLFAEVDQDEADAFFDNLTSGAALAEHDPIFILRNQLIRAQSQSRRPNLTYVAALYIKAFNYWREGREVRSLTWRAGGLNAEQFPKVLSTEEIVGG